MRRIISHKRRNKSLKKLNRKRNKLVNSFKRKSIKLNYLRLEIKNKLKGLFQITMYTLGKEINQ